MRMKEKAENRLFSIIVPVYNVECYVGKCLASIFEQGLNPDLYEVIVVDDGTKDDSMNIVHQFNVKYANLHVIRQKNSGVSIARNVGMAKAKGKYVTFIDADDWIVPGSLEEVSKVLSLHDSLDMLIVRSQGEDGREHFPWGATCESGKVYSGVDVFRRGFHRGSVCGGFYNTDMLARHGISFPQEIRNGEDCIFFNLALVYTERLLFMDEPFYMVFEREGSASRAFEIKHLHLMSRGFDVVNQIRAERSPNLQPVQRDMLSELLYSLVWTVTFLSISVGRLPLATVKRHVQIEKYLPIRFETVKENWKLRLLNTSYSFYYWLMKLKLHLLSW